MTASTTGKMNLKNVNLTALLSRLRANPRLTLFVAMAAVIALAIVLLLWARQPEYRVLYNNLSDQDGGEVVAQLKQMNIPYHLSESGSAITVPADSVREVRMQLAQQGLPRGGAVGFELLDQEKFGISQFSEQVNYQRALEGELSRTIESLGTVRSARVHLAIPKPSLFMREKKTPTASVTLSLMPGRALDNGQVNAITWMVASAVPELPAGNVTVVDQSGRLLSQNGGDAQSLNASQLKFTSEIESEYQRRIQSILAPVVGSANVHAQVTAQLDFDTKEQTLENYKPNADKPENMAIRSRQSSSSEQGGSQTIGGVPGALSNQPTPAARADIEKPAPAGAQKAAGKTAGSATATAQGASGNYSQHKDDITNYEVDRTLTHIKARTGEIKRLSVAVVVNYLPDAKGKPAALTKKRLDEITALVRESMGFSEARGDTLNVVNAPFTQDDGDVQPPLWQRPEFISLMMTIGRYLLVLIVLWLIWRKALKPMWMRQQELFRERINADLEAEKVRQQRKKESDEASARAQLDAEMNTQHLRDIADQDPRIIALVLRQWLAKEQKKSS